MKTKSKYRQMGKILAKWQLYLMTLPAVIAVLIFCYKPMYGLIIAFKDYKMKLGYWNSPWVGLDNFQRLFTSNWFPVILKSLTRTLAICGPISLQRILSTQVLNTAKSLCSKLSTKAKPCSKKQCLIAKHSEMLKKANLFSIPTNFFMFLPHFLKAACLRNTSLDSVLIGKLKSGGQNNVQRIGFSKRLRSC